MEFFCPPNAPPTCGHILVIITKKTPETKILIEWWWHAERYTKRELLRAFEEAEFLEIPHSGDFRGVTSG